MSDRKTAFVTGASRGIGKAVAVALAEAGFDVAITARTLEPGEQRDHSSTVKRSDNSPLPGSLRETGELVEKTGREVLLAPADLIDRASLGSAATMVLERWGHVDIVVHNGRFVGPGHMDTLIDAPISAIENHMEGNFYAPLVLNKIFLPRMIERGIGRIITLTSGAAYSDTIKAAGSGGWGISYSSTKSAIHRVAGTLAVELEPFGILSFNVDPGSVATERIAQDMAKFGFENTGEPPEVVGAVVAWLASQDAAAELNGQTVFAAHFCAEHNLLPGYTGPKSTYGGPPDPSAARLAALQNQAL